MKIAVLSDIHGNLAALQAVLEDVGRHAPDLVVNLGDILSGPLQPAETADLLMARGFPTIAGNHERQLLRLRASDRPRDPASSDGYAADQLNDGHWQWLASLPATAPVAEGEVLMTHGTPTSDLLYWLETATPDFGRHGSNGMRAATADEVRERRGDARSPVILCGHTHVARAVHCGETLIVNPGSVGLQAYDWDQPHYHRSENGTPHARYALVEKLRGGWAARLQSIPYDWQAQSRLAQERGRPDWAHALATGRMPPATMPA